jgi:hypothetical protein
VRGYLGFEDALNNFWEGRTEYIQDLARRRYERNPRELELSGLWLDRGRGGLSLRLTGIPRYVRTLTPGPAGDGLASRLELAGWQGYADAFHDLGSGWAAGLRARLKGCDRKDYTGGAPGAVAYASRDFARLRDVYARPWLERRLGRGWRLRGLAQARWSSERHDAGAGAHVLETRHLGGMATVGAGPWTFLDLEVGLAEDWVRVKQRGPAALDAFTHGTRNEARAVIQVDLHRDGAHLVLIETFEGNREGYQTVGFHDKGFAHLVIEF